MEGTFLRRIVLVSHMYGFVAQYKERESSSASRRRDLVDFLADAFVVAPITELALLHASLSSSSSSSTSSSPLSLPSSAVASTFYYVMNYSSDMLAYSLGAALTDGIDPFSTDAVYSSADKLLSEIVLRYWTNFIRTGYVKFCPYFFHIPSPFYLLLLLQSVLRLYLSVHFNTSHLQSDLKNCTDEGTIEI